MSDQKMDAFFTGRIDKRNVDQANQFKTAPTGAYNVQFDNVNVKQGDQEWNMGRILVDVRATLYGYVDGNPEPRRLGTAFGTLSPDLGHFQDGSLDTASKLWGQAIKALVQSGALPGDKEKGALIEGEEPDGEAVISALRDTPFRVYVLEKYKSADGKNYSIREGDDATRTEVKKQGIETRNDIASISVYREE